MCVIVFAADVEKMCVYVCVCASLLECKFQSDEITGIYKHYAHILAITHYSHRYAWLHYIPHRKFDFLPDPVQGTEYKRERGSRTSLTFRKVRFCYE